MSFWRSKITEEMVKKATEGYSKACSLALLSNAKFDSSNANLVNSTWSQKCPEIGKKRSFHKIYSVQNASILTCMPLKNEATESISASAEGLEITLSKLKNHKGDDVHLMEVLSSGNIVKSINVSDLDIHGLVYYDSELGGISINPSASKLAYIAEAKKPKNAPFFPAKVKPSKTDNNDTLHGQEYTFNEEWGEQLVGKSQSVIVIVDMNTWEFDVLNDLVPEEFCPGQLEWIADDVLTGIAMDSRPYRLGMIYCTNRPCGIFNLNLSQHHFQWIKEPIGVSCKLPKTSPQKRSLIWIETDLQEALYPGPHAQCFRMVCYDLESKTTKVVVPVVDTFDPEKDDFAGIYCMGQKVPEHIFITEDVLVWNAIVDGTNVPMLVDIKASRYFILSDYKNHTVMDTQDYKVLMNQDDPLVPPSLKVANISPSEKQFKDPFVLNQPQKNELNEDIIARKLIHDCNDASSMKFSSIFVGSSNAKALVVWPHGGPHSAIPWAFSSDIYYMIQQGFACLLINYRGSISQGQGSIMSLPGKVGDQDVKDCYQAYVECRQLYPDLGEAVLFGGSHGGFLVTHLIGQYPDEFKACIARNPVINIASMSTVSDIGDWTFNESGLSFKYRSPNPQEQKIMYEKSPIFHIEKVKTPVFLMIGKDDLRVPCSQGVEYYHNLKALGKLVDMNMYEDNHPLGKVQNHANVFVNSVLFFKIILGIE